ncbi:hypothetical protein BH11ARM2_BH11ARM2_24640 [soil metagenome]
MLNALLEQVKQMIFNNPSTPHQPGNDPGGLIGGIEDLFRGHQSQMEQQYPNIRPASEDPLGDPADREPRQSYGGYSGGSVEQQFPGIRPASEDPLGDPADR